MQSRRASCRSLTFLLPLLLLATAALLAGCGRRGLEKAVISGRVTYQEQPVEEGNIRFVPIRGTKGPATTGTIRQGEYTATARGGVPVGTLRVEIEAYRPIPGAKPYMKEEADGTYRVVPDDIPKEQFLPPKYNTNSTVEITIESGSKSVTKDIELH